MTWKRLPILLLIAATTLPVAAGVMELPLGDPERRERQVELVLDGIVDAHKGDTIAPDELAARLDEVSLVLFGESHTSMPVHRAQLRLIRALNERGRSVMIGLEMYPATEQAHLDRWSRGYMTEEGFVEDSEWYRSWGYHWGYYRDIFLYAREHRIPMHAVNVPPKIVRAVREKGYDGLSEEEAAFVPGEVDSESADHLRLFKAFFADADFHNSMSDEQWQSMLDAQCLWDAAMSHNAIKALQASEAERPVMVVLVGSGHLAYDLGLQRQARQWFDGPIATVIPEPVVDPGETTAKKVQASYADFLWGLPEEREPLYPYFGASTRLSDDEHREVVFVAPDSVAALSGLQVGDVVLAVKGQAIDSKLRMNRILASLEWGDSVPVQVRRGEETLELMAHFRRTLPSDDEDEDASAEDGE